MPLEDLTGVKFVGHLVPTNPDGADDISQGDDHIRGLKNVIQQQFGTATDGSTALVGDLHVGGNITVDGTVPQMNTYRNMVINGELQVSQRGVGATVVTAFNGSGVARACDMWNIEGGAASDGSVDVIHFATGGPDGFPNYMRADCVAAETNVLVADFYSVACRIEGRNLVHLKFGTGAARKLFLRFQVRSPKTGIHCVSLANVPATRNYVAEFTVAVVNTWESFSIEIPGDTVGAFVNDSDEGMRLRWHLVAGTTHQVAPGAWAATGLATVNQQNLLDNVANNFDITGVSLEPDLLTDYEHIPDDVTLLRCYRYFYRNGSAGTERFAAGQAFGTTSGLYGMPLPTKMRQVPTLEFSGVTEFRCMAASLAPLVTTNIIANTLLDDYVAINASVASGLIAGNGSFLGHNGGFIDVLAEL